MSPSCDSMLPSGPCSGGALALGILDRAPRAGSWRFPALSRASVFILASWGNCCMLDSGGDREECHSGRVCGCCVVGCDGPHCFLVYLSLGMSSIPTLCRLSAHHTTPRGSPTPIFQGSSPGEVPGRKEKAFLNLLGRTGRFLKQDMESSNHRGKG